MPNGETTIFVYDAGGKSIAEYSTIVASATEAKISYLTNDHLGSPRITTDATGQVISRRDFHPFGEEIFTAQRTQALGYTADSVRQKFTTYERDNETNLDFAQARYFRSGFGRFNSPDTMMASARRIEPQTFNRYGYVVNNPLRFTDPTGFSECPPVCREGERVVTNNGSGPVSTGKGTGLLATVDVNSSGTQAPIETTTAVPDNFPSIGPRSDPPGVPVSSGPIRPCDIRLGPNLGLMGISVGGFAGAGAGDGAAITGSLMYGINTNDTGGFGFTGSYGAGSSGFTGDPSQSYTGAAVGAGLGGFWSNADSFNDLTGNFDTTVIATPIASLQIDNSGPIYVVTLSPEVHGLGTGAGFFNFKTTTPVTREIMLNSIPSNPARVYPEAPCVPR